MKKYMFLWKLLLFLYLPAFAGSRATLFAPDHRAGALLLSGKYLYAALNGELCTFDISTPAKPKLISKTPAAGERQLVRGGEYLYLSCRAAGVQIFSLEDPARPRAVNRFFPVELATGLAVSGNVLAVTQRVYGVEFFDVSDPRNVVSLGLFRTREAQSACFFGKGKIAVGDWGSQEVTVGDVGDILNPATIARLPLGGRGDGVTVKGNFLYAATGQNIVKGRKVQDGKGHGLEIFDISDLKNIVRKGVVKFDAFKGGVPDWWSVHVSGETAFVGDTYNGVYVVDVKDKSAPELLRRIKLPLDAASQIAVGDGVVYVSGHRRGLYLFKDERASVIQPEVAEIKLPSGKKSPPPAVRGLRNLPLPGFVWSLARWDDTLFAACGTAGLKEFKIAADGSPELQKTYPFTAMDCAVSKELLIVAADSELKILDRASGKTLSSTPAAHGVNFLQVRLFGNMLCCSNRSGRLYLWDVTSPEKPRQIRRVSGGGLLYDDMLPERTVNGMFPVNWHSAYPRWYNLKFKEVAAMPKFRRCSRQTCGITEMNGKFYLIGGKGVSALSPDDPAEAVIYPMLPRREGIPTSDGNIMAVSSRRTGKVYFYKFDGKRFTAIREREKNLNFAVTGRVIFHNKRAYIPAGHCGIYFENSARPEK